MNLNGQNKQSGTILNGKPLYNYDLHKAQAVKRHHAWHRRTSFKSRKTIGKERMYKKLEGYDLASNVAMVIAIVVVVAVILFMIIFG